MPNRSDAEITRLCAERVMGWKVTQQNPRAPHELLLDDGYWKSFDPLNRIEDAWMVAERMRMEGVAGEHGCHFVMGMAPQNQVTVWFIDWIWAIGKRQNEVPRQDAPACLGAWTSHSACRAIVTAALMAVGEFPK